MTFISGSAAARCAPHSRVLSVCGGSITNSVGIVAPPASVLHEANTARPERLSPSGGRHDRVGGYRGGTKAMAISTTGINRKKLLLPTTMARAGWALVEAREDVEGVSFVPTVPKAELHRLLEDVSGVALGVQPFSDPELDAAPELEVVSRIGVGYDAVDVPALTRRKIPLMIGGTANSVTVAEAGVFLTMSLARRGAAMDALVKEGRWQDRYKEMPVDLYGKTVLIIGFGKIGTRSAKRFAAMETNVLVSDPYIYSETIRGMGYEPVQDLDAAVARADFITIHRPKTPETTGLFNAARLTHMKRTAFIVNTARGG